MSEVKIVLIYATGCEHCDALKPHFDEAKATLKKDDPNITVEEWDQPTEEKIKSIHTDLVVDGYPTLAKIVDGKVSYFGANDGDRNSESDLVAWAKKGMTGGARKKKRNKKTRRARRRKTKCKTGKRVKN
jgi:thiol-disulfide isomerase/thioredoxin